MKLISITWSTTPRLPGLRPTDLGRIELDKPGTALEGWRVSIRGSQVFFASPRGWLRDQSIKTRDVLGPSTVFGPIPMSDVYLEWAIETEADADKLLKGKLEFDSPSFGWKPAPIVPDKPILDQIPQGQMGDA